MRFRITVTFLLTCLVSSVARAQSYTAAADLFFGDNTEFASPFARAKRSSAHRAAFFLEIVLNDAVVVRGGLFGLGRFGSHEFLEHAEPMIALEVTQGPSRFLFGSLDTVATRHDIVGPDYETPHGLLPPLQRETLAFTRGQEMGLQWLVHASRINHDAWINWQRLNTRSARERFDAGYRSAILLNQSLQLHGQWHLVHEGGQQFASGPVSDSQGVAVGLEWSRRAGAARIVLDGHPVLTLRTKSRNADVRRDRCRGIPPGRARAGTLARAPDCVAQRGHVKG